MKTVYLTFSVSRRGGGLFESVRRLTQSLQLDQDIDAEVIGLSDDFTQADIPLWDPVRVRTYPVLGPHKFGYSPQLLSHLFEAEADLVHVHGLWTYISIAALKWSICTGKPLIISTHGMLNPWALRISAWKKKIAAWLYEDKHLRRAACIRALCKAEANVIRMYGLRNPIAVIPNGINIPEVSRPNAPPWAGRIGDQDKVILYLGWLHPKKGLENLLHAWKEVWRSGDSPTRKWQLAIAGWDQNGYEQMMKKMVDEFGLKNIHFLGPKFGEEKAAMFSHADAFILPSFSEGMPMTILEAWAYGLPVVMTEECNLSEGFSTGSAIKIKLASSDIYRGLMELFSKSDDQRRQMGERGRKLVEQRFEWKKISTEIRLVYEWMLGLGERPASIQEVVRS